MERAQREVNSLDVSVRVAFWNVSGEIPNEQQFGELHRLRSVWHVTYLGEEPPYFEWPEDRVYVEHKRVWVRSVNTVPEV